MTKKIVIKIGGTAATHLTPAFFETIKNWQNKTLTSSLLMVVATIFRN